MARIDKYKASQVIGLLEHNARTDETRPHNHRNEDIDPTRTKFNYELHSTEGTAYERFKARMEQVHCMKRDDVTVLDGLVVTLPKNVRPEDERKFFQAVYDFACKDYGKENIVNATVHKDETTPHIHIGFIPVVKGKLRNGTECEKVRHSDLITKTYLDMFHKRLSDHVKDRLGYETEILNGSTASGNQTITELKLKRLQSQVKEVSDQLAELRTARDDELFEKVGAIKAISEKLSGGAKKLTAAEVETVKNVAAAVAQMQAEYQRRTEEAEQKKKAAESHEKALQEREQNFDNEVLSEAQRLSKRITERSESEVKEIREQARQQSEHVKKVCEFVTGEPFKLSEQKFNAWVKEQNQTKKQERKSNSYPSLG